MDWVFTECSEEERHPSDKHSGQSRGGFVYTNLMQVHSFAFIVYFAVDVLYKTCLERDKANKSHIPFHNRNEIAASSVSNCNNSG